MDLSTDDARARVMGSVFSTAGVATSPLLLTYVLPPISPTARLVVNDRLNLAFPFKYRVAVNFNYVRVQVNRAQLEDVSRLQRSFDAMSKIAVSEPIRGSASATATRRRSERPEIGPLQAPRQWWCYAVERVIARSGRQQIYMRWYDVIERATMRARYIYLFNAAWSSSTNDNTTHAPNTDPSSSSSLAFSAAQQAELDTLEYTLTVNEILVFREVALSERHTRDAIGEQQSSSGGSTRSSDETHSEGWWGGMQQWIFGKNSGDEMIELTADERRAIASTVNYHDTVALSTLPKDFIVADTSCNLDCVVLALNDDSGHSFVELVTSGTYAGLLRQHSWTLRATLQELKLKDNIVPSSSPFSTVLQFLTPDQTGAASLMVEKTFVTSTSPAALTVRVATQPLEIVAAWSCVRRLVSFF
jgi:hypothetical protein